MRQVYHQHSIKFFVLWNVLNKILLFRSTTIRIKPLWIILGITKDVSTTMTTMKIAITGVSVTINEDMLTEKGL